MLRTSLAAVGLAAATTAGLCLPAADAAFAAPIPARPVLPVGVSLAVHATATPLAVPAASPVPAQATTPAPAPAAAPTPAGPTAYTVQPGDCLWTISQRYDVSVYALAAANNMRLSDILLPGRVLALPPAGTGATAAEVSAVSVSPGYSSPSSGHSSSAHGVSSGYTSSSASRSSSGLAAGSGLESCIISRESGGNPQARNGAYWGLYQFSSSTWAAYGGSASSYGSASAAQQQQVFDNAIARGGASNWTPYDGC